MTKLARTLSIILFVALLANLVGFYFFQTTFTPAIRLLLTLVVIWVWGASFLRRNYEPLILVTLYLMFYNLNNLYLGFSLPLWSLTIAAAILTGGFFSFAIILGLTPPNIFNLMYAFLIGLITAEIFLTLALQPSGNIYTNSNHSIIIVVVFYLFWRLINLRAHKSLTKLSAAGYTVFTGLVSLFILWYFS